MANEAETIENVRVSLDACARESQLCIATLKQAMRIGFTVKAKAKSEAKQSNAAQFVQSLERIDQYIDGVRALLALAIESAHENAQAFESEAETEQADGSSQLVEELIWNLDSLGKQISELSTAQQNALSLFHHTVQRRRLWRPKTPPPRNEEAEPERLPIERPAPTEGVYEAFTGVEQDDEPFIPFVPIVMPDGSLPAGLPPAPLPEFFSVQDRERIDAERARRIEKQREEREQRRMEKQIELARSELVDELQSVLDRRQIYP